MDLNDIDPLYVKLTQKLTPEGSEIPESERDMFLDDQLSLMRGWSQDIAQESQRINLIFTILGDFSHETLSYRQKNAIIAAFWSVGSLAAS